METKEILNKKISTPVFFNDERDRTPDGDDTICDDSDTTDDYMTVDSEVRTSIEQKKLIHKRLSEIDDEADNAFIIRHSNRESYLSPRLIKCVTFITLYLLLIVVLYQINLYIGDQQYVFTTSVFLLLIVSVFLLNMIYIDLL
ncbi:hypothetical protein EIN_402860 [Entamoeba invadens IP1]|uniref:Uncharacterized protein n=1 Tax=Entamoeba invadens IP1 TaxID=370355 RepID=A0A0A1U6G1_ENTIV|nr:hypothetical protein EIN_402860 [Entamoeba invadens IP1]ELP89982.1 hypothetical protein EIN_402860 [Entamoeba invadens IP1]|eukprot:XP_004256753.1 hypothetical protein EIN_402860 [Entamoeba invadens IP1]